MFSKLFFRVIVLLEALDPFVVREFLKKLGAPFRSLLVWWDVFE